MSTKYPWLNTLSFVGFEVNSAIEGGFGDGVSFDDIYTSIERGALLEDLDKLITDTFDFSLYPAASEQNIAFNYAIKIASEGIQGRESRKVGIKKSGLHLLVAIILEAIQQQYWVIPDHRKKK
ncbi:hypothetical protein HZA73_09350 [candidate division TA06 bacterium]|nr:hypothetical protein [candidate division TA06 bacterium]